MSTGLQPLASAQASHRAILRLMRCWIAGLVLILTSPVCPVVGYPSVDRLIEVLEDKVVRPAEAKFNELLARRTKLLRVENV